MKVSNRQSKPIWTNGRKKIHCSPPKYANEKKSIDECCSYIMGEARKRGNAVAISDEEVYGMAVHYYDEDDIKINRLPAGEKNVRIILRQTCGTHRRR